MLRTKKQINKTMRLPNYDHLTDYFRDLEA